MNRLIFFHTILLFSGCTFFDPGKEEPADRTTNQQQDTSKAAEQPVDLLADTNKVFKLRQYATDWNNTCLPMPAGKVLLRDVPGDPGYLYLITSVDSLTGKISTEKERSAAAPCSWKQRFKSGITYNINLCKESGTSYKIETLCTDKKSLVALVDIIFQRTLNIWDADSSSYKPILEGAGNYYSIQKNGKGTYDILYTTDF